jgi:hypothetical protein
MKVLEQLGIDLGDVEHDGEDENWDAGSAAKVHPGRMWWWREPVTAWLLGTSQSSGTQKKVWKRPTRDELKADIHLSLDYALRNEVFTAAHHLSDARRTALKEWLDLLYKVLPASFGLSDMLKEMTDNFMYVARSEDYLVAILDEFPPAAEQWSEACSHGEADAGYTCGLWQLFHVVTVSVVDHNEMAVTTQERYATERVALTIRNYVDQFLSCDVCRQNFVRQFDTCAYNRCQRLSDTVSGDPADWRQLPLWLYETHNAVNLRLLKEQAAREDRHATYEEERKVQWPPAHDCIRCWKQHGNEYDAEAVCRYLKLEYGQRDAFSAETRRELMEPWEREEEERMSSSMQLGEAICTVLCVIGAIYSGNLTRLRWRSLQSSATTNVTKSKGKK